MSDLDSEWHRKGATLSDKTAFKEFALTRDDIIEAARAGTLQCRQASIYGNPSLRLLRREVEALVEERQGAPYLTERRAETELSQINKELKRLKTHVVALEKRKAELLVESKGHER